MSEDKFKQELKEYKSLKRTIEKLLTKLYMTGYMHGTELKEKLLENVRGFKNDKREN